MALWRARDVQIYVSTTTTSTPSDFFALTDTSYVFKGVEFKEPERTTGEVKLLGATSGNANSETYEEDATPAELSGDTLFTAKKGDTFDLASLYYTYSGTAGSPQNFNFASDPANPSIMVVFGDSTDYVGFIMTNTKLNTTGGVSVEGGAEAEAAMKVTSSANETYKVRDGTYSV